MNAVLPVVDAKPTIALLFNEEEFVRRNRIVEKLEALGLVVKKRAPVVSASRIDYSLVSAIVVMVDRVTLMSLNVAMRAAEASGRPVFRIAHQTSTPGWQALEAWAKEHAPATPPNMGALAAVAAPKSATALALPRSSILEAGSGAREWEQIAHSVQADLDTSHLKIATLEGELAAARTKHAELEAETARLRDAALKEKRRAHDADREASNTRDARDEHATRARRLADEKAALEKELVESRTELHKLTEQIAALEEDVQTALDSGAAAENALAEAKASATKPSSAETKLRRELAAKDNEIARLEKLVAAAPAAGAAPSAGSLAPVVNALRTLVDAKAMSEAEAWQRLAEAAR